MSMYLAGSCSLTVAPFEFWLDVAFSACNHPEVDRIWLIQGIYYVSFQDNILSTSGWLQFSSRGIVRLKATYKNPPLANNQKGGGKPMNGANGRGGGKGENGYHNGYSNGYSNGSANGHGPGSEGDHAPRFGTNRPLVLKAP